jgi:hypothetical protein
VQPISNNHHAIPEICSVDTNRVFNDFYPFNAVVCVFDDQTVAASILLNNFWAKVSSPFFGFLKGCPINTPLGAW